MRALWWGLAAVVSVSSCRCTSRVEALSPADLHVEPVELTFPETYLGHPSRQTVTLTNRGQQPGQVSFGVSKPFSVERSEFTINGGDSVEVTVEFAPTVSGPASDVLSSGALEVSLRGVGLEVPECAASVCRETSFDVIERRCSAVVVADETSCVDTCIADGRCRSGTCVGRARDCSDGDACTIDACGSAGCTHAPRNCPAPTNPCRIATCDSLTGCGEEDVIDGTLCGADTCTERDVRVCISGACVTRQRPNNGRCQNTWVPLAMPARDGRAVVWDSVRQRVLAFGGRDGSPMYDDTWEFDGEQWTQRFPAQSPPALASAGLAFDSARRRGVLFGGTLQSGVPSAQTWEWDGVTWLARLTPTAPPARSRGVLVYDSGRRKTVLFGGSTSSRNLGDTWEWDGLRWTERQVPGPSPRSSHAMVFDERRGRVVLVGGFDGTYLSDVWEWDGTSWAERTFATRPGPRSGHGLAWDGDRQRVVMIFGATGPTSYTSEVWEWDGVDWLPRPALDWPGFAPLRPSAVFDTARHRLTVVSTLELFAWNGAAWHSFKPSYRPGASVTFDSNRGVVVLFGGQLLGAQNEFAGETWEWDGTRWLKRTPTLTPPGRYGAGLAFDADRNRVVLFGGSNKLSQPGGLVGIDYDDTWEWDGTSWTQVTTATRPPAGVSPRLTFVPTLHRTVLLPTQPGRWTYDGASWQQDSTTVQPVGPAYFDAAAGKLAVISVSQTSDAERALLDAATWLSQPFVTQWTRPSTAPMSAAFDGARGVAVIHYVDTNQQPQTWEFDGTAFTHRQPQRTPRSGSMLYDSARHKVMLYDASDTWVFLP